MRFISPVVLLFFSIQIDAQGPRLVVPTAHNAWITEITVSHDGKYLATSAFDNSIKLWDYAAGKEINNLSGHSDVVNTLAFSPDNQWLASGSWDGEVRVWSVKTGKTLKSYRHNDQVNALCFSPDGKRLASVSNDSLLLIYSLTADSVIDVLNLEARGYQLAFTPDNLEIIVMDDDTTTETGHNGLFFYNTKNRLWDSTGRSFHYIQGNILDFALSPDGKYIYNIVDTDSGQVRVHDLQSNRDVLRINGHFATPSGITASDSSNIFYTSSRKLTGKDFETITEIIRWDVNKNCATDTFRFHGRNSETSCLRFVPVHNELLSENSSISIIRIHANPLKEKDQLASKTSLIDKIFQLPNGDWVASNDAGIVSRFAFDGPFTIQNIFQDPARVPVQAALLPDSSGLYLLTRGTGKIERLRFNDKKRFPAFSMKETINFFNVSRSGKYLALAYGDLSLSRSWKSLRIVDLATQAVIADTTMMVGALAEDNFLFTPDEKGLLITHNWSGGILQWNFAGHGIQNFGDVQKRTFPNSAILIGSRLVTTYVNRNQFYYWDTKAKRLTGKYQGGINDMRIDNYDPTRHSIFVKTFDGQFGIYDYPSFKKTFTANIPGSYVSQLGYSLKGGNVFTYSLDNIFRIWQYKPWRLKFSFIPFGKEDFVFVTPDNYYYASREAARQLYYVTADYRIITFEQLDLKYNRPDKVLKEMGSRDLPLIQSYYNAYLKRLRRLGVDTSSFRQGFSVPEADIVNRDEIHRQTEHERLQLHIRGTSTENLDRFNIWINEVPVFGKKGVMIRMQNSRYLDTVVNVTLGAGENQVETSVTDINGTESFRMPLMVTYTPVAPMPEVVHFIGIGIDRFANTQYNLNYSCKDIRDLAVKLKEKFDTHIIIDTLFNENVSVENVKALKQGLLKANENDKVIISYSGHGLLNKELDYFLSTYSVNFRAPEQNGLPYDELEDLLDSIPSRKKLLLIDACHSGEIDKEEVKVINRATDSLHLKKGGIITVAENSHMGMPSTLELMQTLFTNVSRSTGATVISAASGTQYAMENGQLQNGVFTYSILEALISHAHLRISELKKSVGERVVELTNGLQKPTTRNETLSNDWELW